LAGIGVAASVRKQQSNDFAGILHQYRSILQWFCADLQQFFMYAAVIMKRLQVEVVMLNGSSIMVARHLVVLLVLLAALV
jgi:hypothetical protein